jgi:hypothetical protein
MRARNKKETGRVPIQQAPAYGQLQCEPGAHSADLKIFTQFSGPQRVSSGTNRQPVLLVSSPYQPEAYAIALPFMFTSMLCWGSWANT